MPAYRVEARLVVSEEGAADQALELGRTANPAVVLGLAEGLLQQAEQNAEAARDVDQAVAIAAEAERDRLSTIDRKLRDLAESRLDAAQPSDGAARGGRAR